MESQDEPMEISIENKIDRQDDTITEIDRIVSFFTSAKSILDELIPLEQDGKIKINDFLSILMKHAGNEDESMRRQINDFFSPVMQNDSTIDI